MEKSTHSMNGKTVLITGGTRGIGKETALALAELGARTIIVGRDAGRTTQCAAEIQTRSGNPNVEYLTADLSSLADTRRLAQEVKNRCAQLHVLINNAGAIFIQRQESAEGIEMTWALNHLSPFLLTNLLLDLLSASAPARIITVSSSAHRMATMRFEDLEFKRGYRAWLAYGQSKMANIYFTLALQDHLDTRRVCANVLHPGFVATNFGRSNGGVFNPFFALTQLAALSPQQGAQTSIYLASSPEVEGVSGKYFVRSRPEQLSARASDLDAASRLWSISQQMTGLV